MKRQNELVGRVTEGLTKLLDYPDELLRENEQAVALITSLEPSEELLERLGVEA